MTSTPIILETYTANYLDNDTPSDIIGLGTGADGKFHLYLKTGENNWVAVDKSLLDFDGDGKADPLVMPTAATGYLDIQPKALPPLRTDLPADVACTYEYDTRYSFGAPRGFRDWSETSPTYKGKAMKYFPLRRAVRLSMQHFKPPNVCTHSIMTSMATVTAIRSIARLKAMRTSQKPLLL